MKTLRYDPKSIRSGLTLVTLLCWILPILIIVTMFSVLVNYYNDRNLCLLYTSPSPRDTR